MAKYDVYHMEERLREIDPAFTHVVWNDDDRRHEVMAVDRDGLAYIAFTVNRGELDGRLEELVRYLDPKRGYKAFGDIDEAYRMKEQREERKLEEMAREMANQLRKPLLYDAYGA